MPVVTKWFVDQTLSDVAERVQASRRALLAPQLMIAAVTYALRKHIRARDITLNQASVALQSPPNWFSEIAPMQGLVRPALAIARSIEHRAYDCLYRALAETRSTSLVTADKRLIDCVAHTKYKSHVVHLTDWT